MLKTRNLVIITIICVVVIGLTIKFLDKKENEFIENTKIDVYDGVIYHIEEYEYSEDYGSSTGYECKIKLSNGTSCKIDCGKNLDGLKIGDDVTVYHSNGKYSFSKQGLYANTPTFIVGIIIMFICVCIPWILWFQKIPIKKNNEVEVGSNNLNSQN